MLSERLKSLRKKLGLTQKQMASIMGTNYGSICEYEKGKYVPNAELLSNLKNTFPEINMDWLISGEGSPFEIIDHEKDELDDFYNWYRDWESEKKKDLLLKAKEMMEVAG